jgi:cellulose synthase operon protein C
MNLTSTSRRRTRVNVPLVLAMIAAAGVSLAGMYFVHAYQVRRNAASLLERVQAAKKDGELNVAIHHLQNYVIFRPNDIDALAELAELIDQTAISFNDMRRVYFRYENVLRQDPDRTQVRRRLVEVAMRLHRYSDALEHLKHLRNETDRDVQLALHMARSYEGLDQVPQAAVHYVESLLYDETNIEAYRGLAELMRVRPQELPRRSEIEDMDVPGEILQLFAARISEDEEEEEEDDGNAAPLGEMQRVDRLLARMVERGQPPHQALLARASALRARNELERAEEDITRALELSNDDPEVYRAAAELALSRAREAQSLGESETIHLHLEQARSFAERERAISPDDPAIYLILYHIARLSDELEEGEALLKRGLDSVNDSLKSAGLDDRDELQNLRLQFQWSLADLLIMRAETLTGSAQQKELEAAGKLIRLLRESAMDHWMVTFLDARIDFTQENWFSAIPKFERVRNQVRRDEQLRMRIDLALGYCYRRLQNPDGRIDVFRRALSDDPLWTQARLELAQAYSDANRLNDAMETYRLVGGVPGVPFRLAQLMMLRELRKPPEERRWEPIRRALEEEERLRQERDLSPSSQVAVLRAELLWQQGRHAEARELVSEAREQFPDQVSVRTTEAGMALSDPQSGTEARIQKAENILDQVESELGDHLDIRLLRARIAVLQPPKQAASSLAALADETGGFSVEEQAQLLQRLARLFIQIDNPEGAVEVWQRLLASDARNVSARLALAESAERRGDDEEVGRQLEALREIEGPTGPYSTVLYARRLLRQADASGQPLTDEQRRLLTRARSSLENAAPQRPSWPLIPRLLGDIEQLLGNRQVAVENYQRAFELGDQTQSIVSYVVQHLYENKRFDEADAMLRSLAEENPQLLSGDLARMAWQVAWQRQQYDEAIGLASEVAESSENFRDMIWLSHLRFARGERGESVEKPLRNAVEQFPEEPTVWIALVSYLERVGRRRDAEAAIHSAAEKLPPEPLHLSPLTLGRCLEITNHIDKAETHYQKALQLNPEMTELQIYLADFYTRTGQHQKAGEYLEQLTDSQRDLPEAVREWARRRQAQVSAAGGTYADIQRGLQMLSRVREGASEFSTVADLRARAQILSQGRTRADLQSWIAVLKDIDSRGALTTTERLQLARVYLLLGEWSDAREMYETLLEEFPNAILIISEFAQALAHNHEFDEAREWLDKLKAVLPDAFSIALTDARILAAEEGPDAAAALLREFFDQNSEWSTDPVILDLLTDSEGRELLSRFARQERERGNEQPLRTIEEVGRLLTERRFNMAIQELRPLVDRHELGEHVRSFYLRRAARLLTQLGEHHSAEELFRRSLQGDGPQERLELVGYLARLDHVDDALDLCEALWGELPDPVVARASVAVLRATRPNADQVARVEARLTQGAGESFASPNPVRLQLADLRDLQGRYEEAVELYSQCVQENDRNVVALNNLAFLSALLGQGNSRALEAANKAIRLAGPAGALLDTRGVVYTALGETEKAIRDLKQAAFEDPSPEVRFRLAYAYWRQGDEADARRIFQEARQDGLTSADVHPLEVEAYEQLVKAVGGDT